MVFVHFFKFEPTCLKYMNKSFALRFNFALIVAVMSFGLGIFYIPIQQNQNALGSYDSTSNPSSTSSGTSVGPMNSTDSDNSSNALSVKDEEESINGQMLQVVLKIQNSIWKRMLIILFKSKIQLTPNMNW